MAVKWSLSIQVKAWMDGYTQYFYKDVITYTYHRLNVGLANLAFMVELIWVLYNSRRMWFWYQ